MGIGTVLRGGCTSGAVVLALSVVAGCAGTEAGAAEPSASKDASLPSADASARTQGGAPADASKSPPIRADFADVALPSPTDFADVTVPVNFNEPVWLPPPSTNIEGDATDFIGSWVLLNPDGTVCTPTHTEWVDDNATCLHLDIQKGGGGVVGTIQADRPQQSTGGIPLVAGPFAPATDPNVGYPTTVSPNDYFYAEQFCAGVEYRVLDGVVTNGSLSFMFSTFDLWSGWCALQTPSVWEVAGERKYRCVPQTADPSTTNLGKLALCTSASDGPLCTLSDGSQLPCACVDDAGLSDVALPLCTGPVCECSASECRATLRSDTSPVTLALKAGRLVGSIELGPGLSSPLTFEKVM
jgi:hypothetical protein